MEFQLPSVLQKKLTPYDEVRRKVEAEKKKAVRKASKPFHLGLPPLDLLIPNDVLPRNCDKEELIKRISTNELKYRYLDLTYPQQKGYEEEIRHQNGKPLTFKKTDRLVHSSSGKRVQRRILLYHFEGMWTCLWVPHTNKYVYGYSFAFKDTTSNQNRFVGYGRGVDDRIFLRPNQYDDERTRRLQHLGDNAFNGYSWNDCSTIKVGRTNWRYKTVYVTKDMIKQGHDYEPAEGVFNQRKVESWHEKSGNLKGQLKEWRRVLRGSIPVWKTLDEQRGYYGSRDLPLFNRIFPEQNTLGYVIQKRFEHRQENWEHTYRGEVKEENKYLVLDPMKKWDVDSLKALLFRLTNKCPLDLYERRHNIGDPFWKEGGMIEKPYFRKMLHFALKHSQDRLEASGDQTMEFVTVPIERMLHMIKWVNYILSVWPDTPIDHFQTYEEYLMLVRVPSAMKDMDYYRSRGAYNRSEWLENQSKMVEIKKKYLRQMPVKTFFEIIKKKAEEYKAEDHHSSYDFQSEMNSHMYYFREWTDTMSLLDDIIGSQALEGTGTPASREVAMTSGPLDMKTVEISKPRRWRLTEFHDHLMGIQWKTRNEDFNLPQDLFAKPVKVTWQQAFDGIFYENYNRKEMWSDHENSVISFFQPITSHQLADWGRAVRNCVGNSSYAGAINRKRYFIVLAMVDHKPRYTIQLKLSDGVLVVDQIADIGNRRLSDTEKDFVEKSIAYALQHIAEEDPNYEPEEVSK